MTSVLERTEHAARAARRSVQDSWREAAHAQYLAAEQFTSGHMLSKRGIAACIDPWLLFSGNQATADAYASHELQEFWADWPRLTVTECQRQERRAREVYRDELDRDDSTGVRPVAGERQESARVHRDGIGDDVPAPNAAAGGTSEQERQPSAHAGRGPAVHAGRVMSAWTPGRSAGIRASVAARTQLAERAGQVRNGTHWSSQARAESEPEVSEPVVPAAYRAQVATRQPGTMVAARERIDGSRLLRDVRGFLRHFAVWPSEAALTVATCWIAACWARDGQGEPVWEYCCRLLFTAAEYGAGKSWLAKLCASLCPFGKVLLEPTKPSLIDMIAEKNTVVVTEVDELLATPGRNRGIVAVINASYEPGHYHTRKQGGKTQEIHLFGPMVLDGVDSLLKATRPDMRGLVSRCLVIRVKMAPDGYRRPRWDKQAQELAQRGRDRLAAWMGQMTASGIGGAIPELPEGLGTPRRCALYEPLFAVAMAADLSADREPGHEASTYWRDAIADAALQLEASLELDDDSDQGTELDAMMAGWDEAL